MAVDNALKQELEGQIKLLENLRDKVVEAIADAAKKLELVEKGQSREDVFPRT